MKGGKRNIQYLLDVQKFTFYNSDLQQLGRMITYWAVGWTAKKLTMSRKHCFERGERKFQHLHFATLICSSWVGLSTGWLLFNWLQLHLLLLRSSKTAQLKIEATDWYTNLFADAKMNPLALIRTLSGKNLFQNHESTMNQTAKSQVAMTVAIDILKPFDEQRL